MTLFADARIPVILVPDAEAMALALVAGDAAVLVPEGKVGPDGARAVAWYVAGDGGHAAFCGCCGGRGSVAPVFDRLFLDRVRGAVPWFRRVVALVPGIAEREAVRAALRDDAATAGRFRAG